MWIDSTILASFQRSLTDIHRVYTSEWGWIERYGEDYVVVLNEEQRQEELVESLFCWSRSNGLSCKRVFLKKRFKKEGPGSEGLIQLYGEQTLPLQTICQENGLAYSIRFHGGSSPGLFIDQRQNRVFLRKRKIGRLLNLFAFSCSFGLCAAIAGGQSWNVDLSAKFLEWGKENYRLNGVDPTKHTFLAMDARESLKLLHKKHIGFDHIIIDPPTFSCGRHGKHFSFPRDFEEMLDQVLDLCSEEVTTLFLSTNYRKWETKVLFLKAQKVAAKKNLKLSLLHGPFPLPDIPLSELPACCWIEVRR
ncbi:methyltransferase [Methylacidiphilum kamchatkense Kam1]|uniref:Methyltransferase n=1 Tax=Methylacidiphilum kamchatkense Kam1 TaxID=1202785 RepID=A0A0C1RSE2_9BACT|nr:class I SAM-dependent methyltransferase [Methylacidiphilum kamchatkense]KIE57831.1 methyltransferase [Methylacidiphilum kamchatkense Kam1]QDQ41451.1 23S rRNA (cytosine1962-C5)-methyltransferase [Methylacidiphilum kamchatkense Kam1]